MNRQMKRRLERNPELKANYYQNLTLRQSTILMLYIPLLYFRDKKGYGKKRLGDMVEGCVDILSSIDSDYLDFNDIIEVIFEETGVTLDFYGADLNDAFEDK